MDSKMTIAIAQVAQVAGTVDAAQEETASSSILGMEEPDEPGSKEGETRKNDYKASHGGRSSSSVCGGYFSGSSK